MPISLHTDVMSTIQMSDLTRLGGTCGATGKHMYHGLDSATNIILTALVERVGTIDGAEIVFRKVGEFNGSVLQSLDPEFKPEAAAPVADFGRMSIESVLGEEKTKVLTDWLQEKLEDVERPGTERIFGIAAALIFDHLGSYRKQFGFKRDAFSEVLKVQAQQSLQVNSTTGVVGQLGLRPGKQIEVEATESSVLEENKTNQQTKEVPKPPTKRVSQTTNVEEIFEPSALQRDSTEQTTSSNTTAHETKVLNDKKPKSRIATWLAIGLACLLIPALAWFGMRMLGARPEGPQPLAVTSAPTEESSSPEPTQEEIEPGTFDAEELRYANSEQPGAPPETTAASTLTMPASIAVPSSENRDVQQLSSLVRFEQEVEPMAVFNRPEFASPKQSTTEYWWDRRQVPTKEGYVTVGPWQVKRRPRNTSTSTYFSYR